MPWVWRRQIPAAQTELWLEKLAWLDLQRVIVSSKPGAIRSRLEVYGSSAVELRRLLKEYGGGKHAVSQKKIIPADRNRRIRVHSSLYVVGDRKTGAALHRKYPSVRTLLIPAGMAFGSGEHATTGLVLRQLGKERRQLDRAAVLDLGTGSGILALTTRAMGAEKIIAMDNDPDCVRISRNNEHANFPKSTIRWKRAGLDEFDPGRTFNVVLANLFSELLITNAERIWTWVAPQGRLLLSGILKTQSNEVVRAFRKQGAKSTIRRRRGKWMMLEFIRL